MRKLILKWLLGENWETYEELLYEHHHEMIKHKEALTEEIEVRKELIRELNEHKQTLTILVRMCENCKILYDLCKKNGIPIPKEVQIGE